jgi:hypothetical protein
MAATTGFLATSHGHRLMVKPERNVLHNCNGSK